MNPDIYSSKDILLVESLLNRFRLVILENESLYGFTLNEFDKVAENFPDVDLLDEGVNDYDDSRNVLNNMFAFMLNNNPVTILTPEEIPLVEILWQKLKNA